MQSRPPAQLDGAHLWLQKRASRHLPPTARWVGRNTGARKLRSMAPGGSCVRLSTADSRQDVQSFRPTRHMHRLVRRGLLRLLFLFFSTVTDCKRPRGPVGRCIDGTPGACATPVRALALALGSQWGPQCDRPGEPGEPDRRGEIQQSGGHFELTRDSRSGPSGASSESAAELMTCSETAALASRRAA